MIKKALVIVLGILLIHPLSLRAKENRGGELIITKKDGLSVKGELITVKQDSLLLLSEEGADVSVNMGDVREITMVRTSRALRGLAHGASYGAIVGFIGYAVISSAESDDSFGPGGFGILAPVIMIPLGALLGLAIASGDKTIRIEGKPDSEIRQILEDLQEKARIPNFQ